jgi:hypothetical protein
MSAAGQVTIERIEREGLLEFVLHVDGQHCGFLEYTLPEPGVMRIEYVEVLPALRGSGLGRQLVQHAVAFARHEGRRVIPICSYARAVIQSDPRLTDATRPA